MDQSLVQVERVDEPSEARYRLLETIREYAADELEASGEREEIERRHALYYVAFAERMEPLLRGDGQLAWLDRLELEHDNLRAALGMEGFGVAWDMGGRMSLDEAVAAARARPAAHRP